LIQKGTDILYPSSGCLIISCWLFLWRRGICFYLSTANTGIQWIHSRAHAP